MSPGNYFKDKAEQITKLEEAVNSKWEKKERLKGAEASCLVAMTPCYLPGSNRMNHYSSAIDSIENLNFYYA